MTAPVFTLDVIPEEVIRQDTDFYWTMEGGNRILLGDAPVSELRDRLPHSAQLYIRVGWRDGLLRRVESDEWLSAFATACKLIGENAHEPLPEITLYAVKNQLIEYLLAQQ